MPGIGGFTNVTIENITEVMNATNPAELYINVNNLVYEGWLVFLLLVGLFFLLYRGSQKIEDQMLINLMYSAAFLSIIGFLARAVPLLTDTQMWIFPVLTALLAGLNWMIKKT